MKHVAEDENSQIMSSEVTTVDPIVRGFINDWDAVEDLLHHVLYSGLGWEIDNEGQILLTDPLCTPKVRLYLFLQIFFVLFRPFIVIVVSVLNSFECSFSLRVWH